MFSCFLTRILRRPVKTADIFKFPVDGGCVSFEQCL